ncbi:MAG: OmpA family protein [Bacteroidia bacterium]
MNTIITRLFLFVCITSLFACVPIRKLKETEALLQNCENSLTETQAQVAALQIDTMNLGRDYRALQGEKRLLESTSSSELQNLNKELRQREQELATREARLRELQGIINRQDSMVNALRNTLTNALVGFPKDELSVEIRNGKVYVSLSDKLLFPSGSTAVEPKGKDALVKLSEVLAKNQDIDILIEGHTDNVPVRTGSAFKDNWDLSVLRATSIVRILTSNGVDSRRILPSGRSEYYPVAENETAEGKSRNRRTEIILSPKLDELFKLIEGS